MSIDPKQGYWDLVQYFPGTSICPGPVPCRDASPQGAEEEVWPACYCHRAVVRWGMQNSAMKEALFHLLSSSQLQMFQLTSPGSPTCLLLLCSVCPFCMARALFPLPPFPPHPPPPSFFLPLSHSSGICALPIWEPLQKEKCTRTVSGEQNNTQRRKILDDHLGLRVHPMNCQECYKSKKKVLKTITIADFFCRQKVLCDALAKTPLIL